MPRMAYKRGSAKALASLELGGEFISHGLIEGARNVVNGKKGIKAFAGVNPLGEDFAQG